MIKLRFTRHHLAGLAVITTPDPTKHIKLRGNSTGHCPKPKNPIMKRKKTKPTKNTQSEDIPKHSILLKSFSFLHVFLYIPFIDEIYTYTHLPLHYAFISRENAEVPTELWFLLFTLPQDSIACNMLSIPLQKHFDWLDTSLCSATSWHYNYRPPWSGRQ